MTGPSALRRRRGRSMFSGQIAGVGTTSGVRVVVGTWRDSPFGAFSDVMLETAAGHRVLLAPSADVAEFVAGTYLFDEVRIEPVRVVTGPRWEVSAGSLDLRLVVGRRTTVGRLLRLLPRAVAASPSWCAVTDPVARLLLRGVRTRGTARAGRREFYGALDAHAVVAVSGSFDGESLGGLAPVVPACRFGFSSTPRRPSVTTVVTTVLEA